MVSKKIGLAMGLLIVGVVLVSGCVDLGCGVPSEFDIPFSLHYCHWDDHVYKEKNMMVL
jgi:predicted metalloprotease